MLFVTRKNQGLLKIKMQANYWENYGSELHYWGCSIYPGYLILKLKTVVLF